MQAFQIASAACSGLREGEFWMMRLNIRSAVIAVLCASVLLPMNSHAADDQRANIEKVVAQAIRPVMQRYGVPGVAVGIVISGQSYVYDYGVASKATGRPITRNTLFEIGSVSKTFTATLASYAQVSGKLSLSDSASKYLPSLRGSSFDKVSLLNLGTHTSGGLPLQVPDNITNRTTTACLRCRSIRAVAHPCRTRVRRRINTAEDRITPLQRTT
jgi:beta-lactamase class C